MTIRSRLGNALTGGKLEELEQNLGQLVEVNKRLAQAYLDGPYVLPPEELTRQLVEYYDPQLVDDLIDRLNWEAISGYSGYSDDERTRAVNDSKRMWKYSIIARWIVNLWTYYGLGEDVEIVAEDEAADEIWQAFVTADRNQSVLAKDKLDDVSRWLLITGERFFAFFASEQDGETTVRNIIPTEITGVFSNPEDVTDTWFYERQWTPRGTTEQKTLYYVDWQTYFSDKVKERWEIAQRTYNVKGELAEQNGTAVCVLFVPFLVLDEDSVRGWPLLAPHGTPWLRAQREFMENRSTVARAKASYVRRYQVSGGSRAVDAVKLALGSNYQFGGTTETNPPPAAGSSEIINKAIDVRDLSMATGASDAKTDNESFAWYAFLAGGVFPHYGGMGDAYRLATATAMEKPLQMQFSLYRNQLSAMFRKVVRIVLQFAEKYGNEKFETYDAQVSTDRLVEIDLAMMSNSVAKVYNAVINPGAELGTIPDDIRNQVNVYTLQTFLAALGAENVQDIVNLDMFQPEEPTEERGLAEKHHIVRELVEAEPSTRHPLKNRKAYKAYGDELRTIYDEWVIEAARELEGTETDEREELLAGLLLLLAARLKKAGRAQIDDAFTLGLDGAVPFPQDMAAMGEAIQKNDWYIDNSFIPAVGERIRKEAQVPGFEWSGDSLTSALGALAWRTQLYKGTFWSAIGLGVGAMLKRRYDDPPVERYLDPVADHCATCPPKARQYSSWSAMVAEAGIPGDGSDDCNGGCKCGVNALIDGEMVPML